ncbi:MAG: BTAD domain-containing putative transcriptional regulator [Aeromicrobium erythreum]
MTVDRLLADHPTTPLAGVVERSSTLVASVVAHDWRRLAQVVRRPDGRLPVEFAWRCGYALHHLGHLVEATEVFAAAGHDAPDAELAQLEAARAGTAWLRGDEAACEAHAARAEALAEQSGDDSARASAWVVRALLAAMRGDRDENQRAYQRALDLAKRADDRLTQVRILNNLASRALEEGRAGEALGLVAEGLALADETGHLAGQALLRHNLADALLALGRLDEALVESEAARMLWEAVESPMVSASWQMLGDVHAARGNATQAAAAYADAVATAEAEDDAQTLIPALAGLAVTSALDEPDLADEAVRRLEALDPTMGDVPVALAAGWVALSRGDVETARSAARRARTEAGRRRDLPRLADALELLALAEPGDAQAPRLREAADIWRSLEHPVRLLTSDLVQARLAHDALADRLAVEALRAYGIHDDAWRIAGPLQAVARRDLPVRVHALGAFVLEVDGAVVPSGAWPSRKARDVLKILAAREGHAISREELAARLWPDVVDFGNRLSVALSHLRSVLVAPEAVRADRASVSLDPAVVEVDVAVFRTAARRGLAAAARAEPDAARLLQAAAAMHTGELLATDPPDDWVLEARESLETLGVEVLRALARLLAAGPQPEDAVSWYARLVANDPYDEPTYVDLVSLLSRLGRHGEARRHQRAYLARMRELGVPARDLLPPT